MRVIFDLSSVNGGIPPNWYEGRERKVVLPSPDDVADLIIRKRQIDISRVYHIFQIDQRDWPLTGIKVGEDFYLVKSRTSRLSYRCARVLYGYHGNH